MKLDKKQSVIVKDLALRYNLTTAQVEEIIESPFIFIKKTIVNIDLTNVNTEEEFKETTKNFNIPYIGKMYANYYNFKRLRNGIGRNSKKETE